MNIYTGGKLGHRNLRLSLCSSILVTKFDFHLFTLFTPQTTLPTSVSGQCRSTVTALKRFIETFKHM